MGACGLYLGRREVGRLSWENSGEKLRFSASCPAEAGMIYRVILCTESGWHRLGVMLPEDGIFRLDRAIPAEHLPYRALIDRTLPGEVHLPELPLALSAFSRENLPENLTGVHTLSAAWWDEICYLLYPFSPGTVCEAAHYLSISTVISDTAGSWGVFCYQNGNCLPLTDRLRKTAVLQ